MLAGVEADVTCDMGDYPKTKYEYHFHVFPVVKMSENFI